MTSRFVILALASFLIAACASEPDVDPCANTGELREGESLDVMTQAQSAAARCAEHSEREAD